MAKRPQTSPTDEAKAASVHSADGRDVAREVLRARHRRLRNWFAGLAYAAFSLWLAGITLTIFNKGITLPNQNDQFGSPMAQSLIFLAVLVTIGAWWVKRQLNALAKQRQAAGPPGQG